MKYLYSAVCSIHKSYVQKLAAMLVEEETGQIVVPPTFDDNNNDQEMNQVNLAHSPKRTMDIISGRSP